MSFCLKMSEYLSAGGGVVEEAVGADVDGAGGEALNDRGGDYSMRTQAAWGYLDSDLVVKPGVYEGLKYLPAAFDKHGCDAAAI